MRTPTTLVAGGVALALLGSCNDAGDPDGAEQCGLAALVVTG